jgi:outer membrane protein assembly factor BamB
MRKAFLPCFPTKVLSLFSLLLFIAAVPFFHFPLRQSQAVGQPAHAVKPAPPGDDWPTYLHDPQRSAANPTEKILSPANAGHLKKLWMFKTGGIIAASPTVVGGTVYVGSWDGYEYALDAATGHQIWKTFLGQSYQPGCGQQRAGVTSAATVDNGVVYVAGGDANFYALNVGTGGILWKVFIGDPARGYYNYSSPLLYHGNIYYGTASRCDNPLVQGQLLQISTSSHALVNTFNVVPNGQTGGAIWTSPSVDPATNILYIATGNGGGYSFSVVALDATTLTVKSSWQVPASQQVTDSDFSTTPTVFTTSSGVAMVAANNKNGNVYALRADNLGAGPLWQKTIANGGECPECGQGSISSDAFANTLLYVAGGNTTINGTFYQGSVRALDPATGTYRWEHGTAGPVFAALAFANTLLVDGAGSILEVLDAANGAPLFHFQTGGAIYSAPDVANGKIFVGSTDTNLYAFGV